MQNIFRALSKLEGKRKINYCTDMALILKYHNFRSNNES